MSDKAIDIILQAEIFNDSLILPKDIERTLYLEIARHLLDMDIYWSKEKKIHVFNHPKSKDEIINFINFHKKARKRLDITNDIISLFQSIIIERNKLYRNIDESRVLKLIDESMMIAKATYNKIEELNEQNQ